MALTRRRFLTRSALAGAAITAPHPLLRAMLGPGTAHAAPSNPILVLVQLEGGNDGLNTVIPVAGAQRGLYETARPSIGVPAVNLSATLIDNDPVTHDALALHPAMTALKTLYDAGKVAVINGVGYPNQNLSHFRSEEIWFGADPVAPFGDGWFGRYLETTFSPSDLVAVDVDSTLNPIFVAPGANTLAIVRLSDFRLPDDPLAPDLAAKKLALDTLYGVEANPLETSGLQRTIAASGDLLLSKIADYALVPTGWSSNLDPLGTSLARRLKQVASILRYDAGLPTAPTGARFFHVRLGGFDTHTQQGALTQRQPLLLGRLSDAIAAFLADLAGISTALADRTLVVTFSEFGRRPAENDSGANAGTDHGASSVLFAVGNAVNGGVYGRVPALDDLDSSKNLKFHTDFRRVYATIIDQWLGAPGDHVGLLPGAPFSTLGFL